MEKGETGKRTLVGSGVVVGGIGDEGGGTEVAAAVVLDAGAFGLVDVVGDVPERMRCA